MDQFISRTPAYQFQVWCSKEGALLCCNGIYDIRYIGSIYRSVDMLILNPYRKKYRIDKYWSHSWWFFEITQPRNWVIHVFMWSKEENPQEKCSIFSQQFCFVFCYIPGDVLKVPTHKIRFLVRESWCTLHHKIHGSIYLKNSSIPVPGVM